MAAGVEPFMQRESTFGRRLGEALKAPQVHSFVSRAQLCDGEITATQILSPLADNEMTSPLAEEDAFLLMVQMRDWPRRILWEDGRPVAAQALGAGAFCIFDLRKRWAGMRVCPIHQIVLHLPREALDRIAEEEGLARIEGFRNDPRVGAEDVTVYGLAQSLLPAFARPEEANRLFVEHITLAAAGHVTKRFGGSESGGASAALSARQARLCSEAVAAHLDGELSPLKLAADLDLPFASFAEAFERAFGVLPFRWLTQRRLEKAQDLLRGSALSVAEIAEASGFSTVRHFERVFRRAAGASPADWRAAVRS